MRTLVIAISVAVTLAASCGCAGPGQVADPDDQLAVYVEAWEKQRAGEELKMLEDGKYHDSGKLMKKLEELALEFPDHVPTLMACAAYAFESRQTAKAQSYLDLVLAADPGNA